MSPINFNGETDVIDKKSVPFHTTEMLWNSLKCKKQITWLHHCMTRLVQIRIIVALFTFQCYLIFFFLNNINIQMTIHIFVWRYICHNWKHFQSHADEKHFVGEKSNNVWKNTKKYLLAILSEFLIIAVWLYGATITQWLPYMPYVEMLSVD